MNANKTGIESFDWTINPVTGCKFGCLYSPAGCYAKRMARRLGKTPKARAFIPEYHPERLAVIDGIKTGDVFINDMGDLFGPWVPDEWIRAVVSRVNANKASVTWFYLTKNPARYTGIHAACYSANSWLGTTLDMGFSSTGWSEPEYWQYVPSVEDRVDAIDELDYPRKWISLEPFDAKNYDFYTEALHDINVQWVVIGFNTSPGCKNTLAAVWKAMNLVHMLETFGIPVFVKDSIIDVASTGSNFDPTNYPRDFPVGVSLATKSAAWASTPAKAPAPKARKPSITLESFQRTITEHE